VVLQAWIGRDGSIQDLKLVRGSFLFGSGRVSSVKQWRYQPYLINGRAVEAETFVTLISSCRSPPPLETPESATDFHRSSRIRKSSFPGLSAKSVQIRGCF